MLRWINDSLSFLFWLGVLRLAQLAVALFCIAEVVLIIMLWPWGILLWRTREQWAYLLVPIGATFLFTVQIALWQFTWLRIAQRGGFWRALAECFSEVVRYPIVRPPHPWE